LRVKFRFSSGNDQVRTQLRNDSTTYGNTSWYTLSNANRYLEINWAVAQPARMTAMSTRGRV
jgi:hypothetical protein